METVLYQFHFDFLNFLPSFIPLILAVGLIFLFFRERKRKLAKITGENEKLVKRGIAVQKVIFFTIAVLLTIMFIFVSVRYAAQYVTMKNYLDSDSCQVVEGEVQYFHPMPAGGHDSEHFYVGGVYFEYSDGEVVNGYHKAASHGGVITHAGQYLKIKYYTSGGKNYILYIAEIKKE